MINNSFIKDSKLSEVYEMHKNNDGFLYVEYSDAATFGWYSKIFMVYFLSVYFLQFSQSYIVITKYYFYLFLKIINRKECKLTK